MLTLADLAKFKKNAKLKDRYPKQLQRLQGQGIAPACIEEAVTGTIANLAKVKVLSLVIYGEPPGAPGSVLEPGSWVLFRTFLLPGF